MIKFTQAELEAIHNSLNLAITRGHSEGEDDPLETAYRKVEKWIKEPRYSEAELDALFASLEQEGEE